MPINEIKNTKCGDSFIFEQELPHHATTELTHLHEKWNGNSYSSIFQQYFLAPFFSSPSRGHIATMLILLKGRCVMLFCCTQLNIRIAYYIAVCRVCVCECVLVCVCICVELKYHIQWKICFSINLVSVHANNAIT